MQAAAASKLTASALIQNSQLKNPNVNSVVGTVLESKTFALKTFFSWCIDPLYWLSSLVPCGFLGFTTEQ